MIPKLQPPQTIVGINFGLNKLSSKHDFESEFVRDSNDLKARQISLTADILGITI